MIHILNYGMGVESTAILLRWMLEPCSRDFELSDLLVLNRPDWRRVRGHQRTR